MTGTESPVPVPLRREVTVNGVTSPFWDSGGDGEALVFIHGAGNDHRVWNGVFSADDVAHPRLIAVDLPGHGAHLGDGLTGIAEMAGWVAEFLSAAAVEGSTLVGHSMGSLIALETAANHPSLLSGAALVCTSPRMGVNEGLLHAAVGVRHAAAEMISKWSHSEADLKTLDPDVTIEMLIDNLAVLGADLTACDSYDASAATETVADSGVPTLVLIGGKDQMTPPDAGRTMADLLGARWEVFRDAGHMVPASQAVSVTTVLSEWVAERSAGK